MYKTVLIRIVVIALQAYVAVSTFTYSSSYPTFRNMARVSVSSGLLEGEIVENEYGGTYYSFRGIPYAQPPVGNLRFKPPQPLQPWTGVRDAKQFGPACHQFYVLNPNRGNLSEDCLYLNVYTPNPKPRNPLPVMVWIHGGGFTWGSGDDDIYGPQFLIRHGVVLVTFNYRLEALGFLSLDTADIPGNAGMKDQVAALRWVKENIASFSGDTNNITIFGESAGSASVSYQLVSPMSKGLFKRAIAQSGAGTCRWAQDTEPRDKAVLLAKQLGFFSEDDKELYEFFMKQSFESLVKLSLQISKAQKPYEIHFAIVNEKDFGQERFFYGDIVDILQNGTPQGYDIMTGYTKDEGLMAIAIGDPMEKTLHNAKLYNEFFVPQVIKDNIALPKQLEAGRKMRKFYFKNGPVTEDGLLKYLSMDMFVYGVMLSGNIYSKRNNVYIYKFTCVTERNFFAPSVGLSELVKDKPVVAHADDLAYIFPVKLKTARVDEHSSTFKVIDRVTKLWTNFAKYGNPTPDRSLKVEWKPYTLQDQHYLDIGNELKTGVGPNKEELEFWNSIFKEYLPRYSV